MSHSFSDAALQLLKLRYLLRNAQGNVIETPDQMFRRVANAVAKAELKWHDEAKAKQMADLFYEAMRQLQFLANSASLMNAGTDQQQLSACFVLPIQDRIDDIFNTLHATAVIQEQGGGTGFDFSAIHSKAAGLTNTSGTTCGPLAFISLFNDATSLIRQAGKRRGANMGVLEITHPDILDFIRAKVNPNVLQQFNLSIGITDDFMKAVMHDKAWQLLYPDTGNVFETFPARMLWKEIVSYAHRYGDPGLLFV
ncbi:MAG: ribonucleotide reductase N-terminal alpha domain-containing protein, partial [Chitinophagaceae bacterium]